MVRSWGWGPRQVITLAVTFFTIPSNLAHLPFQLYWAKHGTLTCRRQERGHSRIMEQGRRAWGTLAGCCALIDRQHRAGGDKGRMPVFAGWWVKGYIKEKNKKRQRSSVCLWYQEGLSWGHKRGFTTGSINTGILLRKQNAFQRVAVSNCVNTDTGISNPKNINTTRQACSLCRCKCLHWWVTRSMWNPVRMWEETARPRKPKSINKSFNTSSHLIPAPNALWESAYHTLEPEESWNWWVRARWGSRRGRGKGTKDTQWLKAPRHLHLCFFRSTSYFMQVLAFLRIKCVINAH